MAIAVVVLATFLLFFMMTGSILVPLKALLMNVVSLGASFGVLVWVFQYGNLSDLLDFTPTGGIETTIPLLVLAFGFGLATDVAVAIDATQIRCLLVPATMTLLGELNWWAPKPLRRLYARFGVRDA